MPPPVHTTDPDAPIRATDNDAALARLSAVNKGYLADAFIRHIVPRAHLQGGRPPLINIGTFVRGAAIDELVRGWVGIGGRAGAGRVQIVSLGAGSDTRFWRLATGVEREMIVRYVEIDFAEVTMKKAMAIRKSKQLNDVLGEVQLEHGGTMLHSPVYHLLAADLRRPPSEALQGLLAAPDNARLLDPSLPTLLLFECVLVYMAPSASSALLEWFTGYFHGRGALGCVVYEMFGLEDAFGRVMVNNLKARNVCLPGAEAYPTVESLSHRFLDVGFRAARAVTLRDIRRRYIDAAELGRIGTLELVDEVEELELVLEHYAVSWGVYVPGLSETEREFMEWGLTVKQKM